MTRFSIVIPAYNAAPFIAGTLDSVREQRFTDYEVLVTDDGSQDDTGQVVADYAARHPGFPLRLASQENRGIGGARNNGVFRATGEYIAFLDADDRWYPEKLSRVDRLLRSKPVMDVVYHDEVEIAADGKRQMLRNRTLRGNCFEKLLFRGNCLSTSATCVRRELAQRIGGFSENPDFNSAEDYEFWLRLAKAGARFAHLGEVLGEYHRVEGCITSRIEYNTGNIFNVIAHHVGLLAAEGTYPEEQLRKVLERRKAQNVYVLGRLLQKNGDCRAAREKFLQTASLRPFWWKTYAALILTLFERGTTRRCGNDT